MKSRHGADQRMAGWAAVPLAEPPRARRSAPERVSSHEAEETRNGGVVHHHERVRDARDSFQKLAHVLPAVPRVGRIATHCVYSTVSANRPSGDVQETRRFSTPQGAPLAPAAEGASGGG